MATKQTQDNWSMPAVDLTAFRSIAEQQVEMWHKAQSALLDLWQPAAKTWFDNRRQSLEATSDLLRNLSGCKDLGEASALHQKWLSGEVERLAADAQLLMQSAATAGQQGAALAQGAMKQGAAAAADAGVNPPGPRKVA